MSALTRAGSVTELLRFDNVACIRGDRLLFESLSFALGRGDALWLRGPNGVGKSSLIRLAAGLLRIGLAVSADLWTLGAWALPLFLPLLAALVDTVDGHMVDRAMDAMALNNLADVPVSMLSTGQRKRAAMVRVIASGAPIWLLDEPANGMDEAAQARLVAAIATHRANGGGVLLASHFALEVPDQVELDMRVLV